MLLHLHQLLELRRQRHHLRVLRAATTIACSTLGLLLLALALIAGVLGLLLLTLVPAILGLLLLALPTTAGAGVAKRQLLVLGKTSFDEQQLSDRKASAKHVFVKNN